MSTIFISHSSEDNALAQELRRRLVLQGHNCVFLDFDPEQGIVAGQSWESTLYRKLRACRAVIALCTDHYLKSQWCFAEMALARMEGKHIVALLADPLSPNAKLPSILTEKQYIDLRIDTEKGYRSLWLGLKKLDLLGVVGEWDPSDPPYLGLSTYHEKHAPIFFGREDEVRAGLELLDRGAPGLIMVLGASGSGKSSLVRAGMLPRLRRQADRWLVVEAFRPGQTSLAELAQSLAESYQRYAPDEGAGTGDWKSIRQRLESWTDRPTTPAAVQHAAPQDEGQERLPAGDERLQRLVIELKDLQRQPPSRVQASLQDFLDWNLEDLRRICDEQGDSGDIAGDSEADSTPLIEIANHLRRVTDHRDARVLLVIDQFEELLGHDKSDRDSGRLLSLLRASLEAEHTPLMALVTMRSDFMDSFQRNSELQDMDFEPLSLGPMRIDGMRRVIEEPAKLGAIGIDEGLADLLLKDTETPDALPLLSFTLRLLWEDCHQTGKLSRFAYEKLGGLNGAVAVEANAILATAKREKKAGQLRTAFMQMVRLTEEGQYARRLVPWDTAELRPVHGFLQRFEDRRLLVSRAEGGTRVVEVAHEALFRSWHPLRTWLHQHREELLLRQQLERDSKAWDKSGRDSDHLWRGVRLQQARELLRQRALDGVDNQARQNKAFVQASVAQRQRLFRIVVGGSLCVVAVLTGFLGYALWQEDRAKQAQRASSSRELAMAAINQLQTNPRASINTARKAVCTTYAFDRQVLPEAQNALNRAVQAQLKRSTLEGHTKAVTRVFFLPRRRGDQEEVASKSDPYQRLISVGRDQTALLWTIPGTRTQTCHSLLKRENFADEVTDIALNYTDNLVVTVDKIGNLELRSAIGGEHIATPDSRGQGPVTAITIAPGGDYLASAGKDGTLWLTSISESGLSSSRSSLMEHKATVVALAFSGNGGLLASAGWDNTVKLWDTAKGQLKHSLAGHGEAVVALAFKGPQLASAGWDKTVKIWDTTSGQLLHTFDHEAAVVALAFAPDEKDDNDDAKTELLASASWDKMVKVWDTTSGKLFDILEHDAPVVALAFRPMDTEVQLATADWEGKVYLWRLDRERQNAKLLRTLVYHLEPINDLAFSPDGNQLVSASDDKNISVWRLQDPSKKYTWQTSGDTIDWQTSLDMIEYPRPTQNDELRSRYKRFYQHKQGKQDDAWIAAITRGVVQILNVKSGEVQHVISGYSGKVKSIAFSPSPAKRFAIEADEVYEYYLDNDKLMQCADDLIALESSEKDVTSSFAERCEMFEGNEEFSSIWSKFSSIWSKFSKGPVWK
jgi:WD40 repeat protein